MITRFKILHNYKKYLVGLLLCLLLSGCSFFSTDRNRFGLGNSEFEIFQKSCTTKSGATTRLYLGNGGATTAFWYSVTYQDQETEELQFFSSYDAPSIKDIICTNDRVTLKGEKDFDFDVNEIKTKFIKTPVLFYKDKLEKKSSTPPETAVNKTSTFVAKTEETEDQNNPCLLDDYNTPLRFCEVDEEYIKKYIEWQNIEVQENQQYLFIVSYREVEMQRLHSQLLLKDKQTGKFYISNKYFWDAAFSSDGKAIVASAIFEIEPEKKAQYLSVFSKLFHISSKNIENFTTIYFYESGLESVSTLVKISLPDKKIEYLGYLGGEEIAINKNKIILTQFTKEDDWHACFNHIELPEIYCNKMKIHVLEIDENTHKSLKNYNIPKFGEIKLRKKIETFDLRDSNKNVLAELLKLLDSKNYQLI